MIAEWWDLFWACLKIGVLAFGGGNSAIPLLEDAAVPRWLSATEFGELVGVNFALPGVSILKLAGMVGLRAAGVPGLLLAIVGLAAPGMLLTIVAYQLIGRYREHYLVAKALVAIEYAAVALLLSTAFNLFGTAAGSRFPAQGLLLAASVFALVHFLKLAPALAIVISLVAGIIIL